MNHAAVKPEGFWRARAKKNSRGQDAAGSRHVISKTCAPTARRPVERARRRNHPLVPVLNGLDDSHGAFVRPSIRLQLPDEARGVRLRPHHPVHSLLGRARSTRGRRLSKPRGRRRRPRILPGLRRARVSVWNQGCHRLVRRVRGDSGVHGPRGRTRRVHPREHLDAFAARHQGRARGPGREGASARGARATPPRAIFSRRSTAISRARLAARTNARGARR